MEQDTAELHLGRIRDVKDLTGLGDEARDVVKEEVILESPNHQLDTKVRMVTSNENSGGSGGVVSVPVSLPIGSMITGTAYNVITPDQIPHFKQMLCVDNNGYISSGTLVGNMGGDLKTIVIQQQQQQTTTGAGAAGNGASGAVGTNHDGSGSNDSAETGEHPSQGGGSGCGSGSGGVGGGAGSGGSGVAWTDITHNEVFPIRCKTTCAELYRSKLGSGGRGRCVKYKDKWYTPSEFENVCGRGSSKDWKRSIKYAGKSLQSLIDDNVLTPHATNCSCTVCCDDEAASGPVRLFTPYKRRKRNQTDMDGDVGLVGGGGGGGSAGSVVGVATVATKRKRNKSLNNNTDPQPAQATSVVDEQNMFLTEDNITTKDEPWPTLNDSLDTSTDLVDQTQIGGHYDRDTYVVNINDAGSLALLDNSQTMKNLESVYSTMVRATNDFKRIMTDLKNSYDRKIELLQKERDAAVEAVRVQVHTDVDDPNISGSLHGNEMISAKKCANCNREALAECSLCRKTPYCSEFCQRKDWNAHQVECTRNPVQSTQQIMLLVDDQS